MEPAQPPVVTHLPAFATAPGQTDVLTIVVVIFLVVMFLVLGNLYLRLHALPERMAHRANRVQLEIVAVLALVALFTHIHLFWIAALLLAFIEFPPIGTYAASITRSLEKIANRDDPRVAELEPPSVEAMPLPRDEPRF
jgi:hypothetical protein